MELDILLELVTTLPEDRKEEILKEEYDRQKKYIDALCDIKRREQHGY